MVLSLVKGRVADEADHRHRCLLRTRGKRPCCRTAEQGDELASFQSIELHLFAPGQGSSIADW
jgi:hypothetical protein